MINLDFTDSSLWKLIIGIFGFFTLYWCCKWFLKIKKKHIKFPGLVWKVNLDKVLALPLKMLFITLAVYNVFAFLNTEFGYPQWGNWVKSLRDFLVLLSFSWMAYRWKKELFKRKELPMGIGEMFDKAASVTLFVLTALMAMKIFQVDIVPLIAFGGIGAAAMGFAAKDVIGNFFGGGMLSMTRPFAVGDTVILPDRNLEGVVEHVGWYITSIRDLEKRPMYFPNSLFSSIPSINLSRRSHRRILETLGIAYKDVSKMTRLTDVLRNYVFNCPEIDPKALNLVYWSRVGEYALEITLRAYTYETDLAKFSIIRGKVLQEVFQIIEKEGVELAFPTSTLHMIKQN